MLGLVSVFIISLVISPSIFIPVKLFQLQNCSVSSKHSVFIHLVQPPPVQSTTRLSSYSSVVSVINLYLFSFLYVVCIYSGSLLIVQFPEMRLQCRLFGQESWYLFPPNSWSPFSQIKLHSLLHSSTRSYRQVRWTAAHGKHCLGKHKPLGFAMGCQETVTLLRVPL